MAKKIKVELPKKASESLRKRKIEHVFVNYNEDDAFVIVLNKDVHDAVAVIKADGNSVEKVKSVRHYESYAVKHEYYSPKFDCTCRHCGKTFKAHVKEAVWCSPECKKAFRNEKRQKKLAEEATHSEES